MWQPLTADETRDALVEAMLAHVPFDGWSETALLAGAAKAGIPPDDARRAFPGGARSLLEYYAALADRRMVAALAAEDLAALRVRDRIARAVRLRLEQNAPHREAIRAALSALALPHNGPLALTLLYRTVDAIWAAIGDRSVDFNFYTKRALLGGVYLSTLLYWLSDTSDECADSWDFLDRRIDDVLALQRARGRLDRLRPPLFDLFRRLQDAGRGYEVRRRRPV